MLVVDEFLEQRIGDALRHPAVNLSVDDRGIHEDARILHHDVAHDLGRPRLRINLDLDHMAGIGEGASRVVDALPVEPRPPTRVAVRRQIGSARHLVERHANIRADHVGVTPAQHEVTRRALQHRARDLLDLLGKGLTGIGRRPTTDHHRPAGEAAPSEGCRIGVSRDDSNPMWLDAEVVCDELRQRRVQPLAVRTRSNARGDIA
ncbi:unannotated protein [freshwater metagenome]|uniref:Unannotated protein n=1 Tax=freshwater metagenome TaxID=449393 RepID=A0A6J7J5B8_9ZZZZ